MRRWLLPLVPLALAVVLLAATGCGSSSEDGESAARVATAGGQADEEDGGAEGRNRDKKGDPQQAALDFARCMREHGVEMPDPEFDDQGGGRIIIGRAPDEASSGGPESASEIDPEAHEACKHFLEQGMLAPGGKPDPQMQERALQFARCMREHGVNVPDPKFDEGGGGSVAFEIGGGTLDPTSPTLQEAQAACQKHFGPEGGAGSAGPGLAPAPWGRES